MARKLILIPRARSRLEGATAIDRGYAKPYTPDEMRRWAADVERLYATPRDELERLAATPAEQLTPEQRGVVEAHRKLFVEPDRGIKGSLREDGQVELDGGRHRAAYMLERGTDPIPVWVSSPDEQRLHAFEARCAQDLRVARSSRQLGRVAVGGREREDRAAATRIGRLATRDMLRDGHARDERQER